MGGDSAMIQIGTMHDAAHSVVDWRRVPLVASGSRNVALLARGEDMSVYKELYQMLREFDENTLKLVHRVSRSASEDEFIAFVRDEDLEAVRGGIELGRPTRKTIREMRRQT